MQLPERRDELPEQTKAPFRQSFLRRLTSFLELPQDVGDVRPRVGHHAAGWLHSGAAILLARGQMGTTTLIGSHFEERLRAAPWPGDSAADVPRLLIALSNVAPESPDATGLYGALERRLLPGDIPGDGALVALPFLCELVERRVAFFDAYALVAQVALGADMVLRGDVDLGASPDVPRRVARACRLALAEKLWLFLRDACDQRVSPRIRGEAVVVSVMLPEVEATWRPVLTKHLAEEKDDYLREDLRSWLED